MFVFNVAVQVFQDPHDTGRGRGVSVGGDRHEFDLRGYGHGSRKIGNKKDRAFEHADEDQVIACVFVFFGKSIGHFLNAGVEELCVHQHCFNVVTVGSCGNVVILLVVHRRGHPLSESQRTDTARMPFFRATTNLRPPGAFPMATGP